MKKQLSVIAKTSPEWKVHREFLALPDTLLGGTRAMRKAGTQFLPKGSAESEDDYDYRIEHTTLIDTYTRTINFLTGQVFSKDLQLEDVSSRLEELQEDIDQKGNSLSVLGRQIFREGLHAGVSFVFVDSTAVQTRPSVRGTEYFDEEEEAWKPYTLEAAKKKGWRPYWVLIKASQVIDAWAEYRNGHMQLAHFRYWEDHTTEDEGGYSRTTEKKIRVLKPGAWELWRQKDDNGEEWEIEKCGSTGLSEIPIAVFMPGETLTEFTAQPALQGLADLCLTHWQATSGHRHLMDWVRRPPFFGRCLRFEGENVAFGPNRLIRSDDPNADLKSVGVDVSSVAASREDLQQLEQAMGAYGLRLMMPHSGAITASQVLIESNERDSALKAWALMFKDALEQALVYTAMWLGEDIAAGVKVNTDFTGAAKMETYNMLDAAVSAGVVPKQLAYETLQALGAIRDDITWEDAQDMIEEELRANPKPSFPPLPSLAGFVGGRESENPKP